MTVNYTSNSAVVGILFYNVVKLTNIQLPGLKCIPVSNTVLLCCKKTNGYMEYCQSIEIIEETQHKETCL